MYNDRIFSAGSEGKIRVWDLNDGTCVKVLNDKSSNDDKTNGNGNGDTNKQNNRERDTNNYIKNKLMDSNKNLPNEEDEDIS